MLIECPYCERSVEAETIAVHEDPNDYPPDGTRIALLKCPVCGCALVGKQDAFIDFKNDIDWDDPERIWPYPEEKVHASIPSVVRISLEEAKKCYAAKAYSACAVMCGRALEAVGLNHKTKADKLGAMLKELKEAQIIDQRIYDWGEELREYRNLGAHATEHKTSKEEAEDLLNFIKVICNYIYVMKERFELFKQRQVKKT